MSAPPRPLRAALVLALAVVLVTGGCGGDDDEPSPVTPSTDDTQDTGDDSQDASDGTGTAGDGTAATEDDPAPVGSTVAVADWTLRVLDVVDADDAGLLAPVSGFPAPEYRFVAVRYELGYDGPAPQAADPFLPRVVEPDGSAYDVFTTSCVLDTDVAPQPLRLEPGTTGITAACFELPSAAEVADVRVVFEHFLDGGGELWIRPER